MKLFTVCIIGFVLQFLIHCGVLYYIASNQYAQEIVDNNVNIPRYLTINAHEKQHQDALMKHLQNCHSSHCDCI